MVIVQNRFAHDPNVSHVASKARLHPTRPSRLGPSLERHEQPTRGFRETHRAPLSRSFPYPQSDAPPHCHGRAEDHPSPLYVPTPQINTPVSGTPPPSPPQKLLTPFPPADLSYQPSPSVLGAKHRRRQRRDAQIAPLSLRFRRRRPAPKGFPAAAQRPAPSQHRPSA